MIDVLSKLFGSKARVKILRLFFMNIDARFDVAEIAGRVKEKKEITRKEVNMLLKIKFLKKLTSKKTQKFVVNPHFPLLRSLQNLIINSSEMKDIHNMIVNKVNKAGKIKLLVLSGVFEEYNDDATVDLLIVGDDVNMRKLDSAISNIESEFGSELCFAFFTMEDFLYRMSIYDKLVRDIFDYPHTVLVDKTRAILK